MDYQSGFFGVKWRNANEYGNPETVWNETSTVI
jgi:hypothetical protein